jgi:hypothetical protein
MSVAGWSITFALFFLAAALTVAVTQGQTSWVPKATWAVPTLLAFAILCFGIALCRWRRFQRFIWRHLPRLIPPPESTLPIGGTMSQPKPAPNIVCRGFFPKTCDFPLSGEEPDSRWECQTIAFRNTGQSADHVVACLDFHSDRGQPVPVNEAWWSEDADRTSNIGFYIGRTETKHLVVAIQADGGCFVVGKTYSRSFGRFMPTDPVNADVAGLPCSVSPPVRSGSARTGLWCD